MSVTQLATNMLNYSMRIVLVLMSTGVLFMLLNPVFPDVLSYSKFLFSVAVKILLATPLIVVFAVGVFFAHKKDVRMALVSFTLFGALASGGVIYLTLGS